MPAWDNVQLAGPPNGPAWVQAAAQMMNTVGNQVGSLGDAYQSGQNFNYQQKQRNFFQDPNNQAALQQAMGGMPQQYQQYAPLFQALIQSGGAPAAQQLLPSLINQQQQGNFYNALNPPGGGGAGQPQPTTPTAVYHITGNNGGTSTPDSNSYNASLAPNVRQMAIDSGVDPESPQFKRAFAKFDIDRDLTNKNAIAGAQKRIDALKNGSETPNRGGISPVAQSGPGDQESRAAAGNQLNPSMGEGSSGMSPRQTSERRIAQAPTQPAQRTTPIGNLKDADEADALARYYNKLATAPGISQQQSAGVRALAEQSAEKAKEIRKQLGETETEKNERMGAAEAAKRRELRQVRYDKMDAGIEGAARSSEQMARHLQTMDGILNDPRLFTGAGQANVNFLRQVAQNFLPRGTVDADGTLSSEALRKVTAQNLQNQVDTLRADAEEMGGSAGRIMLAQIKIMQDAAQSPDSSIPALRYLTEIGHRAVQENRDIADLARKYKAAHNDELGPGFDKILSDYERKHPMLTSQEERNIKYIAAPRLPTNIKTDEEQKAWARQHGVQPGDPVRINKTYPAQYVPSL